MKSRVIEALALISLWWLVVNFLMDDYIGNPVQIFSLAAAAVYPVVFGIWKIARRRRD